MRMRALLHQALDDTIADEVRGRVGGGRRAKSDSRTRLLKGLAVTRDFSRGMSGAKSGASARGGLGAGAGLLDARQRVIVKAHIAKHGRAGFGAGGGGGALRAHVRYLERDGRDGSDRGEFYDRAEDDLDAKERVRDWAEDRHHFRFIVSPENSDKLDSLTEYVRETMERVSSDLGAPKLDWIAINHYDTDQPHAHVLVRGAREDGRMLVIPRAYISYGFRGRAQEVAQDHLGDLSRDAAEERVRRQVTQDGWTDLDRRLERSSDERGLVSRDLTEDRGTPGALYRGRLAHLEGLELAERTAEGWRIAIDLQERLDAIVLEQDILRQIHQRMERSPARGGRDQGLEYNLREVDQTLPEIGDAAPVARPDLAAHLHERRLTALDWQIQYRFEVAAGLRAADTIAQQFDPATEQAIEMRGRFLVENDLAQENEFGVAPTPQGWRELEERDIAQEVRDQLDIEPHGMSKAWEGKLGRFLGCVETQSGLYAIAEREFGGLVYGSVDRASQIEIGAEVAITSSQELVPELDLGRDLGLGR